MPSVRRKKEARTAEAQDTGMKRTPSMGARFLRSISGLGKAAPGPGTAPGTGAVVLGNAGTDTAYSEGAGKENGHAASVEKLTLTLTRVKGSPIGLTWGGTARFRLRVTDVDDGTPAADSGIAIGDVIISVNGTDIYGGGDVDYAPKFAAELVGAAGFGDIEFVVERPLDKQPLKEATAAVTIQKQYRASVSNVFMTEGQSQKEAPMTAPLTIAEEPASRTATAEELAQELASRAVASGLASALAAEAESDMKSTAAKLDQSAYDATELDEAASVVQLAAAAAMVDPAPSYNDAELDAAASVVQIAAAEKAAAEKAAAASVTGADPKPASPSSAPRRRRHRIQATAGGSSNASCKASEAAPKEAGVEPATVREAAAPASTPVRKRRTQQRPRAPPPDANPEPQRVVTERRRRRKVVEAEVGDPK